MKAIQVHNFIPDFSDAASLSSSMTMTQDLEKPSKDELKKDQLLIKVLACSISPGDVLTVNGNMIFLHPPTMPFVPGMDICGIVVEDQLQQQTQQQKQQKQDDDTLLPLFKKGDVVVASNGMNAVGGMAEYMIVPQSEAVLKPEKVSLEEAAASSSAITARNAVMDFCKEGDRVLVLGGSGGVGSAAIQLAKHHAKASFVATTSTQTEWCKSLGADEVINYKASDATPWYERTDWEQTKFDVIIDTVGGGNYGENKASRVLKSGKLGGHFVAVCGDDPKPDCKTWFKAIKFFAGVLFSWPLYSWWYASTMPSYTLLTPYNITQGRKQVLDMMASKTLEIKLDDQSPHAFTAQGVQEAFSVVASGHAHGKVVVRM